MKKRISPGRSRGSGALNRVTKACAGGQVAVARVLGVKQSAISMWIAGTRSPSEESKEKIHAAYDIDPADWQARPAGEKTPKERPAPPQSGELPTSEPISPERIRQVLNGSLRLVERSIDSAGRGGMPYEMVRVAEKTLAGIKSLQRSMEFNISETQILAHPAWQKVETRILRALADFPEALRAVANAIRDAHESAGDQRNVG